MQKPAKGTHKYEGGKCDYCIELRNIKVFLDPPTWDLISDFFCERDIAQMKLVPRDIHLDREESVIKHGYDIWQRTENGNMPCDSSRMWTLLMVATFKKWWDSVKPADPIQLPTPVGPKQTRVRKSVNKIREGDPDHQKLVKAFTGIMKRSTKDPHSYFVIAGQHGLPYRSFCQHHTASFLPWHRVYTIKLENALRSVEGCCDVTLPYWDLTDDRNPIPDWVWKPPFHNYQYPEDVLPLRHATDHTTREAHEYMTTQQIVTHVKGMLEYNFESHYWEDFVEYSVRYDDDDEHDDGELQYAIEWTHDHIHNLAGGRQPTLKDNNGDVLPPDRQPVHQYGWSKFYGEMADADYAAFDPIFWFHHADHDRLWWEWQVRRGATDMAGVKKWLKHSHRYEAIAEDVLQPWQDKLENLVNNHSINLYGEAEIEVIYEPGAFPPPHSPLVSLKSRVNKLAGKKVVVLKALDRIKIPGSFEVQFFAHVEGHAKRLIGSTPFFQPLRPELCENCLQNPRIDFPCKVPDDVPHHATFSAVVVYRGGSIEHAVKVTTHK